jgi:integrase
MINLETDQLGSELRQVLQELKLEQQKVGNITGHVFTRAKGRPIRDITRAFDLALERAGLQDSGITPHSFRRACITRWTDLAIAPDIVKRTSGHKDGSVHGNYLIFTDEMIVRPFREKGMMSPPSERKTAAAAAS